MHKRARSSGNYQRGEAVAAILELIAVLAVFAVAYVLYRKFLTPTPGKDKFVSDIYTSTRIVGLESKLSNLTPWPDDLLTEVESRAEAAKLNAKITSEIARTRYTS